MKNLEIPKAVLDMLDYNLASDGMREQLEKDYVEMKTGVGSWKGDSVIVRTVQDDNKDLGYTVLVAAPETVHSGADALLDSYEKKLTVLRGKNSMKDAMEKAKELTIADKDKKVVVVAFPEAANEYELNETVAE